MFQFLIVVVVEVFKVSLPDTVPDSVLRSRTSSFQFLTLVVSMEVVKVLLPRQRIVEETVDIPAPGEETGETMSGWCFVEAAATETTLHVVSWGIRW